MYIVCGLLRLTPMTCKEYESLVKDYPLLHGKLFYYFISWYSKIVFSYSCAMQYHDIAQLGCYCTRPGATPKCALCSELLGTWEMSRIANKGLHLLLIFLCSLIQTLTLTPLPNNALLAILDMYPANSLLTRMVWCLIHLKLNLFVLGDNHRLIVSPDSHCAAPYFLF